MGDVTGFQLQGSGPQQYERHAAYFMAPFVQALLDRSQLAEGGALLDVACGTGFVARKAAALVGPRGRLVGADFNAGMIEHARQASEGITPPITYHQASAEALPFDDGEFDAVLCQQGYQFFPDVPGAVADAARVLRPGGRLALTVWSALEDSPYFHAQAGSFAALAGSEETTSFVAAFSFSPETLASACAAAGLGEVTIEQLTHQITLPPMSEYVPGHLAALPWSGAILANPDAINQAVAAITVALKKYTGPDGFVTVPFSSILVSATR